MDSSSFKVLGHGSTGTVFLGYTPSNKPVAIKTFDLHSKTVLNAFNTELAAHRRLKKHSKRFAKVYQTESQGDQGFVVMKLYDQDMFDYLEATPRNETAFKKQFRTICKAVRTLHNAGVAHLDIKPENIFMDGTKPFLGDFGSCFIGSGSLTEYISTQTFGGTMRYAAPEVANCRFFNPYKSDIFSLGILLHVGLTGFFPFKGASTEVDLAFARQTLSPKAVALMEKLLSPAAADRPTIQQVLSDRWFSSKN